MVDRPHASGGQRLGADPIAHTAVWAHRRLAADTWHRVALIGDATIMTTCQRVFVAPMDLRSDVPREGFSCRPCVSGVVDSNETAAERALLD